MSRSTYLDDYYKHLECDRKRVVMMVSFEAVLFALWMAMVYVTGFALYTVDPSIVVSTGWAHAVSHLGWWNIIELVSVGVGLFSSAGYALASPRTSNRLQFSIDKSMMWCVIHFAVVCIAIVADVTHTVLTGLEMGDAESTFYVQSWGFLLAFLIILPLQILLIKVPLLYCIALFRSRLKASYDGNVKMIELFDVTPTTSTNATTLDTPLLAAVASSGRKSKSKV